MVLGRSQCLEDGDENNRSGKTKCCLAEHFLSPVTVDIMLSVSAMNAYRRCLFPARWGPDALRPLLSCRSYLQ